MTESNREWIGVADLMAGLMMVFMFIAIVFMVKIQADKKEIERDKQAIEEIAVTYEEYKNALNRALWDEFGDDLEKWNAEILDDNTVRFKGPEVLFATGKNDITPRFREILDGFFPRYVRLLTLPQFAESIDEVRIEGHTSSVWEDAKTLEERYLKNAALSQERSFAVLDYCFQLDTIEVHREWLTETLRANGLAFAKLIKENGVENRDSSRRVEFRVKTKAEERIEKILKRVKGTKK